MTNNNLPKLIGLAGFARVGKDTIADILVSEYGYAKIAFADTIREMIYALNPLVTNSGLTGMRVNDAIDLFGYEETKTRFPEFRQLLQRMGTEAGRNILGNDIWRKTTFKKIASIKPPVVISDVRMTEEAGDIMSLGGIVLGISRPDIGPLNNHATEEGVDQRFIQYSMNLESKDIMSLSEMPKKVKEFLEIFKWDESHEDEVISPIMVDYD